MSEIGTARELFRSRQRMVDRGGSPREELEQNGARRPVREQLAQRRAAAAGRRDEALGSLEVLEVRLEELHGDAGAPSRGWS